MCFSPKWTPQGLNSSTAEGPGWPQTMQKARLSRNSCYILLSVSKLDSMNNNIHLPKFYTLSRNTLRLVASLQLLNFLVLSLFDKKEQNSSCIIFTIILLDLDLKLVFNILGQKFSSFNFSVLLCSEFSENVGAFKRKLMANVSLQFFALHPSGHTYINCKLCYSKHITI